MNKNKISQAFKEGYQLKECWILNLQIPNPKDFVIAWELKLSLAELELIGQSCDKFMSVQNYNMYHFNFNCDIHVSDNLVMYRSYLCLW